MPEFDKQRLGKQAHEWGFIRDAFEKTVRLISALNIISRPRFPGLQLPKRWWNS